MLRWCASIEAARLLTLSRAWHAAIAAETGDAAGNNVGLGWPAVLMLPWQCEQRTVIELTSSAQLRTEGQAMLHCIGSYDEVCRSGNSVIVSLRAPSGMPVSTAELHLGQGGWASSRASIGPPGMRFHVPTVRAHSSLSWAI